MNCDLSNRVVLVTGCAGGLGAALCRTFASAGAVVVGTDIAAGSEVSDPSALTGGSMLYMQHDVSSEADWTRVIGAIEERFGALDVLVNNAGVLLAKTILQTSAEEMRRVMSVNFEGVFFGLKCSAALMNQTGKTRPYGASVINISSTGGLIGAPLHSVYCASKGAVRLLTKAAAMEYSALGYKIRVNSVHPGGVKTAMLDQIAQSFVEAGLAPSVSSAMESMCVGHPLGRLSEPSEIANSVLFLASDASSYMHGAELVVDGGYTAR